ncbi:hypothetical protein [Cytobacillus oceanisediminis]|uniref:hypothetical protein n=1 Tax=Cytobacillus oceanisediminis TaxID=665099 RepID=UPI001C22930B|nr:hypothetical protein [Cytobacillus oceanisediminis]MBU8772104.1 hypothetical protein [Cytobacillus oceanisediminis]
MPYLDFGLTYFDFKMGHNYDEFIKEVKENKSKWIYQYLNVEYLDVRKVDLKEYILSAETPVIIRLDTKPLSKRHKVYPNQNTPHRLVACGYNKSEDCVNVIDPYFGFHGPINFNLFNYAVNSSKISWKEQQITTIHYHPQGTHNHKLDLQERLNTVLKTKIKNVQYGVDKRSNARYGVTAMSLFIEQIEDTYNYLFDHCQSHEFSTDWFITLINLYLINEKMGMYYYLNRHGTILTLENLNEIKLILLNSAKLFKYIKNLIIKDKLKKATSKPYTYFIKFKEEILMNEKNLISKLS